MVVVFTLTLRAPVFGFPNSVTPGQPPQAGMGEKVHLSGIEGFSHPNLRIRLGPQGPHSPGKGFWWVIWYDCQWLLTVRARVVCVRVGSLTIHGTYPICANAATGTSAMAPELGR